MGRTFDAYLCLGMGGFTVACIFGERPPDEIRWVEFAHYDEKLVVGGEILGTVKYSSNKECVSKARQRFHYEYVDIIGSIPVPANGVDAPYLWGCQRVNMVTGKRYRNEVFR